LNRELNLVDQKKDLDMRKFIIVLLISLINVSAQAGDAPDRILGIWENETKDVKIEIYEKGGKYFGKIVWLSKPNNEDGTPHKDINNPDKKLRNRKIMGMVIISDLKYKNGKWIDGNIYVAKKGKTLDCNIKLSKDNNQLYLTISKGSFFSKTVNWKRVGK
jgi:uncharacterized protein (DUF2147 family)